MPDEKVKKVRSSLMTVAPDIFGKPPILFAYLYGSYARGFVHPFIDLDIAIYIEKIPSAIIGGKVWYHLKRLSKSFRINRSVTALA